MAALGAIGYAVELSSVFGETGDTRYKLAGYLRDSTPAGLDGLVYVVDLDSHQTIAVRSTIDGSGQFLIEPLYTNDPVDVIGVPHSDNYNASIFRGVTPVLVT